MSKQHKPQKQKAERELERLHRELQAERRRTAAMEREISELKRELQIYELRESDRPLQRIKNRSKGNNKEASLLEAANHRAHRYRKSSFIRYLWETVMESAPVRVLAKLIQYLRRVRAVQLILTVFLALGATITVAVVSAAFLPFLFFGTAVLTMLAFLRSRRMNRILKREFEAKPVRVMVPPRGHSLDPNSFFARNAHSMASDGTVIVVVTPYLMSYRGLGGKGGFFTARKESQNLYLVRRHYFFMLRKHVLDALEQDITIIY